MGNMQASANSLDLECRQLDVMKQHVARFHFHKVLHSFPRETEMRNFGTIANWKLSMGIFLNIYE